MGIFDGAKNEQLRYLDEERRKIWGRLTNLEKDNQDLRRLLAIRTSDYEKEAAQHSKKASEFRNRAEAKLHEVESIYENVSKAKTDCISILSDLENDRRQKKEIDTQIKELLAQCNNIKKQYEDASQEALSRSEKLDSFFENYDDFQERIDSVNTSVDNAKENLSKSSNSLTTLNKRVQDIEKLHREIFGYSTTNEDTGEKTIISGTKDSLENAYTNLENNAVKLETEIKSIKEGSLSQFKTFEDEHVQIYARITQQIEQLLPSALTAGLSSAFSKKREDEEISSNKYLSNFRWGIGLLIVVSLIPLSISTYSLAQGVLLMEVIHRVPRLILAIIPMYIPCLWLAISANKKLNLSKRLIEEYAHKEVLSKTYEGLSKQITSLKDNPQAEELRFRLLSNFLQVTSENPGKLISNYESSDHPLSEVLDQSYKLQVAIDKLDGIPGFGKLAALIETRKNKKIIKTQEKSEDGLASSKEIEK